MIVKATVSVSDRVGGPAPHDKAWQPTADPGRFFPNGGARFRRRQVDWRSVAAWWHGCQPGVC